MNLDSLKTQIKNIAPEDLAAHGVIVPARTKANGHITAICSVCGNGSGDTGDGIAFYYVNGVWLAKCHKCGAIFDNFKLLALHYNLDARADFVELCKRAAVEFGIAAANSTASDFLSYHNLKPLKKLPPKKTVEENEAEMELNKITRAIVKKDLAAPDNLNLLKDADRRGIDIETFRFFHCVFCPKWVHPKLRAQGKSITPTRRILIPSSGGSHYVAVLVDSERNAENRKYWKMHTTGKSSIFGLQTLTANTECIFIYEGEFDAMSAFQAWKEYNFLRETMNIFEVNTAEEMASGKIISADFVPYSAFLATGGAAESNWIEGLDLQCKAFGIVPRVIVNFDKDKAGSDGAAKVQKELRGRGYMTAIKFIGGDNEYGQRP